MSENDINSLQAKVDKIYDVIVGDESLGNRGVLPRLSAVERKQEGFDRKLTYAGGFLAGLVVVWEIVRRKIGL